MASQLNDGDMTIVDLILFFRRHFVKMMALLLVFVCISAGVVWQQSDRYKAAIQLNLSFPDGIGNAQSLMQSAVVAVANNNGSGSLAQQIWPRGSDPLEERRYQDNKISLTVIKDNVLGISVEGNDPLLAEKLALKLAQEGKQSISSLNITKAARQISLDKSRLDFVQSDLKSAESDLHKALPGGASAVNGSTLQVLDLAGRIEAMVTSMPAGTEAQSAKVQVLQGQLLDEIRLSGKFASLSDQQFQALQRYVFDMAAIDILKRQIKMSEATRDFDIGLSSNAPIAIKVGPKRLLTIALAGLAGLFFGFLLGLVQDGWQRIRQEMAEREA